jgi:hypothetical protein
MKKFFLKNIVKYCVLAIVILVASNQASAQTYFYYDGSGDLNSTANWGTNTDGTGTAPVDFVTASQIFIIQNATNIVFNSGTWTVSGTGSKAVLGNPTYATPGTPSPAITLTIAAGSSIVATPQLFEVSLPSSGNHKIIYQNTTALSLGTVNDTNLELEFDGATITTTTSRTFGNVRLKNGANIDMGGASAVMNNLTIDGGCTLSGPIGGSANYIAIKTGGIVTINGIFKAGRTGSVTARGGLYTTGVAIPVTVNTSFGTLLFQDATEPPNITLGSQSTVDFYRGSSGQTGTQGITPMAYANLTLSNLSAASAKSFNISGLGSNTTTVSGTLTVNLPGTTITAATTQNITLLPGARLVINSTNTAFPAPSGSGKLTLQSDATGTASIGTLATGASITGNVNIERYIPAKRAWRILTAPLRGSNTSFYSSWQNNGSVVANTGVEIWHPSGGTGITTGGISSNLRTFDVNTNTWVDVTNTQTTNLFTSAASAANNTFLIFPTGPYGSANIATGSAATTLKATGTLQTGTQTFTIPDAANSNSEKIHLLGNPYASPVDFNALTRTNVVKRFWVWDPQLSGAGGYVLVSDIDNDGNFSVTPTSTQNQHLQSGQGFFVEVSNTSASVTFQESHKSTTTINTVFRTGTGTERLKIDLVEPTDGSVIDGVLAEYNNSFNDGIAVEDGQKLFRGEENLYILRNGKSLMLEGRKLIDDKDTIFLRMTNMQIKNYRFSFAASTFANDASIGAFLKDNFLNTETAISLTSTTTHNFSVTSNPASAAADRFMVIYRNTGSLPVTLTSVKAFQQNSGIAVEWNTQSEIDMKHYIVEKSAYGNSFSNVATVMPKSGSTNKYVWFDAIPNNGPNYYRIKAISQNGEIKYSSIVVVKLNSKGSTVAIYPNPVKASTIQLSLSNMEKGNYSINLFNQLGQQIWTRQISHNGGSSNQTIQLGNIASGVYKIRITNGSAVTNHTFIKE